MGAIAKTPVPKSGGAISENTIITLPNGKRLFGLSYKGDIQGWRAELEQCCQALNILWGEVTGGQEDGGDLYSSAGAPVTVTVNGDGDSTPPPVRR